ncbi:MAG: hypothetical protein JXR10_10735 [Cyclobacteriaceae bacterium]
MNTILLILALFLPNSDIIEIYEDSPNEFDEDFKEISKSMSCPIENSSTSLRQESIFHLKMVYVKCSNFNITRANPLGIVRNYDEALSIYESRSIYPQCQPDALFDIDFNENSLIYFLSGNPSLTPVNLNQHLVLDEGVLEFFIEYQGPPRKGEVYTRQAVHQKLFWFVLPKSLKFYELRLKEKINY